MTFWFEKHHEIFLRKISWSAPYMPGGTKRMYNAICFRITKLAISDTVLTSKTITETVKIKEKIKLYTVYGYFSIKYVWTHLNTTFSDLNHQIYVQSKNFKYHRSYTKNWNYCFHQKSASSHYEMTPSNSLASMHFHYDRIQFSPGLMNFHSKIWNEFKDRISIDNKIMNILSLSK